jgi:glutamine synthetase type III
MELLDDIRTQLSETIRELTEDLEELRNAVDMEEAVTEDLEERVKTHGASLLAATGAYRALEEASSELDDDED